MTSPYTERYILSSGGIIAVERTRSLFLNGDVNDDAGDLSSLVLMLQYLANADKEKPINFFINSDGGNPLDAQFLIDNIRLTHEGGTPVRLIASGRAMSAAMDVLAWGPAGWRFATTNAVFMMHRLSYSVGESGTDEHSAWATYYKKAEIKEWKALAEHVGLPKPIKLWNKVKKAPWIFGAKEALEWKLIDGIWYG